MLNGRKQLRKFFCLIRVNRGAALADGTATAATAGKVTGKTCFPDVIRNEHLSDLMHANTITSDLVRSQSLKINKMESVTDREADA